MTRALPGARLVALASLLVTSSGCMIWFVGTEIETGGSMPAEALAQIRAGTPVRDVVARLGPPAAVLRSGSTVRVPTYHLRKAGSRDLDAAPIFARFAGRQQAIGPQDVVHFYEVAHSSRRGHYVMMMVGDQGGATRAKTDPDRVRTERLLLLVDGERRVVRDLIHEVEQEPGAAPATRPADGEDGT